MQYLGNKGRLCVLTTYFNPSGYLTKKANFDRFAAGIAETGLHLIVVEHAPDRTRFEICGTSQISVIRVSGGDVMWQKERLLNIGLQRLPAGCDMVLCCDADVIFRDPRIAENICTALERHQAIQPFSHFVRLPQGLTDIDTAECSIGCREGEMFHGFAYGHNKFGATGNFWRIGSPGFAWAFRRDFIAACGFYDRMILGGGDTALAYGMTSEDYKFNIYHSLPRGLQQDYDQWRRKACKLAAGNIGYTDGTILHLWHGSSVNRRYVERYKILSRDNFDPRIDIACSPEEPWRWTSDKPRLHKGVADYFHARREDSGTLSAYEKLKQTSLKIKSRIARNLASLQI